MINSLRRNAAFLTLLLLALGTAGVIWFVLPHDREVKSLGIFLFKLTPFIFATEAIARMDVAAFKRFNAVRIALPAAFMVFFLFFVPKIFFHADDHPTLYYHVLTLTPFIILSLTLAYRLGGGGSGTVRRVAYAMLLIMLSGAEDLAFLTVNHHTDPEWATIPEVWNWASHITVFIGHPPTKYEAYAFIIVHLVIALFLLTAPNRWFEKLNPLRNRSMAIAATPGATTSTGGPEGRKETADVSS